MIDALHDRIAQIDAQIAQQRAQRRQLVAHVAWFKKRALKRRAASASTQTAPWLSPRKD